MAESYEVAITEIAQFVKQKTDEMNDRIDEMKKDLHQIKSQPRQPAYDGAKEAKKIAELEDRMDKDIQRIESVIHSNLSSLIEQDVKKYLDRASDVRSELKNEMVATRRDLTTQLHFLETKVNDVRADLRALNVGDLEAKIHAFDSKFSDLQVSRQRLHELEEQIENLKSLISSKAMQPGFVDKSIISAHVKRIDEMEKQISDLSKAVGRGTDSVMLNKVKSEMMEKFERATHDISEKIKRMEGESDKADEKMSSSFVERLKKLEDERDKLKAEITEKVERSHSETSEKMKRLEEVIVGRLKLDISKHAGHISSELSSEVGEKMRKEEDIVRKYLKELEKGEGQISALIKRDESEVRKQIQQIVKEEAGSAAKVAEFRKEFDAARKHLDSTMKQLERISRQYEQIKNEPESYDQLFKDVMELKRNVDEESSLRVSADKTIQGIERKLNEMGEGLGKLKELEKLDYTKVLQAVRTREEINQKMMEQVKAEAAGVATRYLDEFAKTLDRKLPNLATKDHIAQLDARLEQIIDKKVRAVRPAVVNPLLERRVESMERTVRELMFVLQELNRQKPFVVE